MRGEQKRKRKRVSKLLLSSPDESLSRDRVHSLLFQGVQSLPALAIEIAAREVSRLLIPCELAHRENRLYN